MNLYIIQTPQQYLFRDFAPKSFRREFSALASLIRDAYSQTTGTKIWFTVYDEKEI